MSGESRLKWTHGLAQYLKPYNYTCYTHNHGNHTYRYFSLLQYPCEGYTTQPKFHVTYYSYTVGYFSL